MTAGRCLMVQGTASSVGKSMLVTALCRMLRQDGYRVAPFKAQNMALNSFVTPDGGEIGRAQAVQAEAAGIAPTVEMNPILLKPEADARSQIVVMGRPVDVMSASEYYRQKDRLWQVVVKSLAQLRAAYDIVVIEGAGSPAEVNIKESDIVNMRVARHADAPVLLVGDIDRGGVFAALLGTLELLEPEERALVRGLVINKFRGDASLLLSGLRFIEERTNRPVLGVIPYFRDIRLADEDSVALEERSTLMSARSRGSSWALDVAVIKLPHIANFDDFDPLAQEMGVVVRYVEKVDDLGSPDLVILPGTKTTMADLRWLCERGLAKALVKQAEQGTSVIGICGGFQMLGEHLSDPLGIEDDIGSASGLGLLPITTVFEPRKTTCQVRARVASEDGLLAGLSATEVVGYEIHMGHEATATANPAFRIIERSGQVVDAADGAMGESGRVFGTYIHGLFDNSVLRRSVLQRIAAHKNRAMAFGEALASRAEQYDRLAMHVREHLDMGHIYKILGL